MKKSIIFAFLFLCSPLCFAVTPTPNSIDEMMQLFHDEGLVVVERSVEQNGSVRFNFRYPVESDFYFTDKAHFNQGPEGEKIRVSFWMYGMLEEEVFSNEVVLEKALKCFPAEWTQEGISPEQLEIPQDMARYIQGRKALRQTRLHHSF